MSAFSDYAQSVTSDITDEQMRDSERYRIIGMLEEKKGLYINSGCSEDEAQQMALSEVQSLGKSVLNLKVRKSSDKTMLNSHNKDKIVLVLKYIAYALLLFFFVMMAVSCFRIKANGIVDTISYLCSVLFCAVPSFALSVYKKSTKEYQKNAILIVSALFCIIGIYRIIIVFVS